jgi:hypothetical protein
VSAPPTPTEHVPDTIEPIVAYRLWTADAELRLASLNGGTTWSRDAWAVAECEEHPAPDEQCTCGLYAVKEELLDGLDLARMVPSGPAEANPLQWPAPIVGRVQLAGKVIEHERGYRAELARLVEVLPRALTRRESALVAGRYGVPLGPEIPKRNGLPA